jgi:hypothetical protein
MKRSQGVHFSRPVEWKKFGLVDYPKLIKEPMDLGTVSENLQKPHYERLESFINDVRLVWKNAFIFNAPDSMYFKAAKTLSDVFEKRCEDLEKEALRPHRSASDLRLFELILKGAAKASLQSPRVVLPA